MTVECDVADHAAVGTAMNAVVEQLGGIDILVNNAGYHYLGCAKTFALMGQAFARALLQMSGQGASSGIQ